MSKYAKHVPMTHKPKASWIGEAEIDWLYWEEKVRKEIGSSDFVFKPIDRKRISEAFDFFKRNNTKVLKIEDAKVILRALRATLEQVNLPDRHLLCPHRPWEPGNFLVTLITPTEASIFTEAMVNTLDDAKDGKSVLQRLGSYLALLRKGECSLEHPRPESIAAYLIKEVFESCGIRARAYADWSAEGEEITSVFESFVFAHILPDLGSDPSAKETLRRRLAEAEKSLRNRKRL